MRLEVVALAVSIALLGTACSGDEPPEGALPGTALPAYPGASKWVLGPVPLGYEWVLMSASLRNTSSDPIRLSAVSLTGDFSRSIDIVRTEIAVIPGTHSRPRPYEESPGVVPGGLYETYPPAVKEPGERCHVQELRPLAGYELDPDVRARILVWLRADAPGSFRIDGHLVTYERRGQEYEQLLPVGVRGRVKERASWRVLAEDPLETACSRLPGVRTLNRG